MRWRWRARRGPKPPPTMTRRFVTPEGVDLRIELGAVGARATAFVVDWVVILIVVIAVSFLIAQLAPAQGGNTALGILWLIGLFVIRNGWFILFEMGRRGATPGKRLMKLRVIARDGGRLTGAAVIARNALREIEIFLPLSFLGVRVAEGAADGWLIAAGLLWTGIFFLFPLFNRDRLRAGDFIAGTWVVNEVRDTLGADLASADVERPRRVFTDAALDLYGIYELQTLEEVLRTGREDAITAVAAAIRRKAGLADDRDDMGFLTDYYAALCARLERGMLVGRRRDDKHSIARGR